MSLVHGGWYGGEYVGTLLLHDAFGCVYAHVVCGGHAMLWLVDVLPLEL